MKPRILILGATGFIGRNMVEFLLASEKYLVHATYHQKPPFFIEGSEFAFGGVQWYGCDLLDKNSVNWLFDLVSPDIVIQAAATTSGSKDIVNNPAMHVTDNAVMNSYVMRAASEYGVKHFLFFSCSVMFSSGEIREDSPIDINPRYFGVAHTKLYCEKLCEFYAGLPTSNTKFTVIRHSNIYGPHDKFDLHHSHVFGATLRKVMDAVDTVAVWGDGEEARDLLYVSDLCEFVAMAIKWQVKKFDRYHCGAGVAVKIKDIVEHIIQASGKNLAIVYDKDAPTIPTSLYLDWKKAEYGLTWCPRVSLLDGIALTMQWYKKNHVISTTKGE